MPLADEAGTPAFLPRASLHSATIFIVPARAGASLPAAPPFSAVFFAAFTRSVFSHGGVPKFTGMLCVLVRRGRVPRKIECPEGSIQVSGLLHRTVAAGEATLAWTTYLVGTN